MQNRRARLLLPAFSFLLAFAAAPDAAQSQARPEGFGTTDEAITIVGYEAFLPDSSPALLWSGSGERSSGVILSAGVNMIPNGALLTEILFYVRDDEPSTGVDVQVFFCARQLDAGSGVDEGEVCVSERTEGVTGETVLTLPVNELIRYRQGIGLFDAAVFTYALKYSCTSEDCAIRLARLHWRRQVSPAPSAASFDDVPTSHPFFRHIEALFDSGITAGCNASPLRFCPEQPITRGEMAVFLAKALGLHWPAGPTP